MVLGSNLCLFGLINGGVVHGCGFESLTLWGSMVVWCMVWVRIFGFVGVNVGVVHVVGSNLCLFGGHQWWCSAWSWVLIFDFLRSMVV
jgi:hypothetical protein